MTTYSNVYPDEEKPFLSNTSNSTNSSTMTRQTNTSWNRLQHVLDDPSLTSTITDSQPKPTVPETIHTKPFTYADTAQASQTDSQAQHTSAISSPTNSRVTITSARAQEIEDKVELLAKAFAAMQAQQEQPPPAHTPNSTLEEKVEQMFKKCNSR